MRPVGGIARMGRLVQQIIKDTLDAFSDHDADKAVAAWKRDQDVDDMYNSLFRELLTYMMEDPRNIGPSTHLMFIAKNIERIGDHATNVAEIIHFLVRGEDITEARPKSDKTSFTVVNAPEDKA
jgi:phosphate transport system protein